MKQKTGVGKILQGIGHFVSNLFHNSIKGAEKDYNALPPEEKALLQHGAGVMAFISQQIGKTGAEIKAGILEQFPDLDIEQLEKGIFGLAHAFNVAVDENNIDDAIEKLQEHFNKHTGNIWSTIVDSAANIFSFLIAPADSKLEAGLGLMKYVYLKFFKSLFSKG